MRILLSTSLQHFELVEMERLTFVDELLALVFERFAFFVHYGFKLVEVS